MMASKSGPRYVEAMRRVSSRCSSLRALRDFDLDYFILLKNCSQVL